MIKNFETYINEDYFSKLANRKDNGEVRKENVLSKDFVKEFIHYGHEKDVKSIIIWKDDNGKQIVDIVGNFFLNSDGSILSDGSIPFQFGKIDGSFMSSWCVALKSLKGAPQEVGCDFDCSFCKNLTSLEGCPKEVGGDFYCSHCGRPFSEEEIRKICNVKGKIIL